MKLSSGFPKVAICNAEVIGGVVDGSAEIAGDGDALGFGKTDGVGLFLCFLPTSDLAASETSFPPRPSLATHETY
jgi:hypothetical protein